MGFKLNIGNFKRGIRTLNLTPKGFTQTQTCATLGDNLNMIIIMSKENCEVNNDRRVNKAWEIGYKIGEIDGKVHTMRKCIEFIEEEIQKTKNTKLNISKL